MVTVTLHPAIDRVIEVPGLALGAHLDGRQVWRAPAGKGVNVSRILARLGVPSLATGLVGRDQLERFETALAEEQVQPQFLAVEGPTRENVTLLDPAQNVETHIRDAGAEIPPEAVDRIGKKLMLLIRPGRVVVFAGSLPPGVSPESLRHLVESCLAAQAHVAVDVSGDALAAVRDLPLWIAKPNSEELATMLGEPVGSDDAMVRVGRKLSRSIHVVMVSCGSAGGYAFIDGSALLGQVDVAPEHVVSTVGCGDALLAGFIAAQLRRQDVRASYRYGLAVATAAAISAVPGQLDPAAVDEFLAAACVTSVGAN